jgi:hypothetical protein
MLFAYIETYYQLYAPIQVRALYNRNKLPINYIINYLFRNVKVYFQNVLIDS